ncbi:MAG: hypothetical protein KKB22_01370 [Candidatus Omnitrophica bacterium]|nr:hypothetical protein [Candidatus Omnitrophota bacterium]
MDKSVKKIVRRWFRHIAYVFTAITIVFFNLSFGDSVRTHTENYKVTGCDELLKAFLTAIRDSARSIVFLLIFIFLCLVVYTTYALVRIIRKKSSLCFKLWACPLLILFNSIFIAMISLLDVHCLTGPNVGNAKVWHPFIGNICLQIVSLIFIVLGLRLKRLARFFTITFISILTLVVWGWINYILLKETIILPIHIFTKGLNIFK